MLLTISTTHKPATDLGFLLHKNPSRHQTFPLSFGEAHVFYPEAVPDRCTVALLLDVDPVGLIRGRRGPAGEGHLLQQYVNDRPYAASSFMSVAIAKVFSTALSGKSEARMDLANKGIPLEVSISVLPCRGGEIFLRGLFDPLGYAVSAQRLPLDERFPEWGESSYFAVGLKTTCQLKTLLSHLYVLIPVLDDEKHYWVTEDETEKLLRHGEGWLSEHPLREQIIARYLKHQRYLVKATLARLSEDDAEPDELLEVQGAEEEAVEKPISLNEQRLEKVKAELKNSGAQRVLDLGCGEGKLLRELLRDKQFEEIVGIDVSYRSLERAKEKLKIERLPGRQADRIRLLHGSLMYRDERMVGYDGAAVVEVIEHLDESRLAAFELVLFKFARPRTVVLTTPNVEYNVKFESLPAGNVRHKDHRFEWSRSEFRVWAREVAGRFGYSVRFESVGPEDTQLGSPTQMGVFSREN